MYLLVGFNPYGFWSVVQNGVFPDSRHFLYFSVSLVLPNYETVQFISPPPDVGKPRPSVLIFHEGIYQGLSIRFTPLEEVFPTLVCGRAKSKFSSHFVILCTPTHLRVVVSTFYQGCLTRAHRHLVFYLPSVQLYWSSAAFHTGWYNAVTLISPTVTAVVRSVCSHFWSIAFPSPQCFSYQDDGRSPKVDRHCLISAFSQPYGAIFLPLSPGTTTPPISEWYLFSFRFLRLVSNGCYCFVSVTGLAGSLLLSVSIYSFLCLVSSFFSFRISSPLAVAQIFLFSFPSCTKAQGWGKFSSTLSPTDILHACLRCLWKHRLSGREGPLPYNLFFEVSVVAGPLITPNLPREVMRTKSIRLDPTPFPWSSRAFAAQL